MKYLLTFLLLYCSSAALAASITFDKLVTVNRCWLQQADVDRSVLPAGQQLSETGWIQLHLTLVEQTLRKRSVSGLSPEQARRRAASLGHLHEYRLAGRFPLNAQYRYRTPIFIDPDNNFCAVGYLLKASGHEKVSRMVASSRNLAYVKELFYPELDQWAADHGFTKEELAWIQPTYPPVLPSLTVGAGVNGTVYELAGDAAQEKLYVGGLFTHADGTIAAGNIAYVTESDGVYSWHNMGTGVNGPVYAITEYKGKIYVAGHFTEAGGQGANNIACWDGNSWKAVGCTYGTVYDLIVYKDDLYASGSFDVCASMSDVNVARWTGTHWQQIPGLSGRVNTMEVSGNDLLLGGAFVHDNEALNVIRWNAQDQYQAFGNKINNEVMDFERYRDTVYAVCKQTDPVDTAILFLQLKGNRWEEPQDYYLDFTATGGAASLNTLCTDVSGLNLMAGGHFNYRPMVGTFADHCIAVREQEYGKWFLVDSTIYKMTRFKGALYAGGAFKYGQFSDVVLNGITRSEKSTTGIPRVETPVMLHLFPNPVAGGQLTLRNDFGANACVLSDISGRILKKIVLYEDRHEQQILLPALAPGIYLMSVSNAKGYASQQKMVVQ